MNMMIQALLGSVEMQRMMFEKVPVLSIFTGAHQTAGSDVNDMLDKEVSEWVGRMRGKVII